MKIILFVCSSVLGLVFCCDCFAQKKTSKYANGVEIKKGTRFTGFTFSLSGRDGENDSQLFAYYIEQRKKSMQVRFDPGYVFKDNLAVGMGFLYGFKKENNVAKASDGTLTENRSLEREFALRPYIKNFIPLGTNHRFYVVIPTELQFGYGSKLSESVTNEVLKRTYSNTYYYGLEMRPGLLAFIVENFGFEINVGAFGLSSSVEKITITDQPDGRVKNNDLSLKINLLQLSLGFAVYF